MNCRVLLSAGSAAMVLASTTADVAIGAPTLSSPILDAARRIAALSQEFEEADVPGAGSAETDRIGRLIVSQEEVIFAATPTTVAEAMVVLMVAAGSLDATDPLEDVARSAVARATWCLAGIAGVDVMELGGEFYLPPSYAGRAA